MQPSGHSLDRLMAPRSIAVIGASSDPSRIGGKPISYMLARGFSGEIWPVNPNRAEIQGLRAYPSIAALPGIPDVAIVAVPASVALDAVGELAACGCGGAVVFSAGFAEVGADGAEAQTRLVDLARSGGMRLLGPNCLGVFDGRRNYYATFTASFDSGWPTDGRIGIASQSGAYGTHVFSAARNRGIGMSLCLTTGNEADVTVGEAIGWMAGNPEVDVIAVYAEGIRDGAQFVAALAQAHAVRKPVVMMKVGRSALGTAAAQSHTASIAGDDAVLSAVLSEFGVFRARTTEELLDVAHMATRRIYPVGNTLGVITVSGGAGVLVSDAAEAVGLSMPPMPDASQARLRELISFSAPTNPVDCTAQVANDMTLVGRFMGEMVQAGGYSSVLGFFSHMAGSRLGPALHSELRGVRERHPDRLYALSIIAPDDVVQGFERDGFACFEDPSRAVSAIAAMGQFGDAFARLGPATPPSAHPVMLPATTPTEAQAKTILAAYGIASAPERVATSADDAVAAGPRARLSGRPQDRVAGNHPQDRDRRRAARHRRGRSRPRRLRHVACPRRHACADGEDRRRAGRARTTRRRRVHPRHPARPGLWAHGAGRSRWRLRRDPAGCPPSSLPGR